MITIGNVERGVASYLDEELIPKLPEHGLQKILAGTAVSILIKRSGDAVEMAKENPIIQMMGIFQDSEDGTTMVDVDLIRDEVKNQLGNGSVNIDVPVIGTMTFNASDIDRIYEHIKRMDSQGTGYPKHIHSA